MAVLLYKQLATLNALLSSVPPERKLTLWLQQTWYTARPDPICPNLILFHLTGWALMFKEAMRTTKKKEDLYLKTVHRQTPGRIFRLECAATDPGNSTDLEAGLACFAGPLELNTFGAFREQCSSAGSRQILKPCQRTRGRACALNFLPSFGSHILRSPPVQHVDTKKHGGTHQPLPHWQ